jgi:transcriptional regulator with XRE-family HTH domain
MPLERVESPAERLKDPEYARAYGEEAARASLAVCLATARIEAGLTQQQLAAMIGRSQPYVSKLESGEANPTLGTIGRILACIGKQLVCEARPLVGGRNEGPTEAPAQGLLVPDAEALFAEYLRSFQDAISGADTTRFLSALRAYVSSVDSADSVSGGAATSPSYSSSAA